MAPHPRGRQRNSQSCCHLQLSVLSTILHPGHGTLQFLLEVEWTSCSSDTELGCVICFGERNIVITSWTGGYLREHQGRLCEVGDRSLAGSRRDFTSCYSVLFEQFVKVQTRSFSISIWYVVELFRGLKRNEGTRLLPFCSRPANLLRSFPSSTAASEKTERLRCLNHPEPACLFRCQ
ncbi:hypothetical protein CB1_000571006 [Camelus ferus]|nr:hypothetical protein CB1_000571006 [Camelus ferus]